MVVEVVELFLKMMAFLHFIANCMATASTFELYSNDTWLVASGVADASFFEKYLTSIYWAVVTCTTVGYGDIIPMNVFEKQLGIIIFNAGVAIFSFQLSQLATLFYELSENQSMRQEMQDLIKKVSWRHGFPESLNEKLLTFFRDPIELLELSQEFDINQLAQ